MYYREVKVSTETELRWAALYGLAWFVCAMVALQLTEGADGIAAVWPSSGIFVAALLHLNPRGRNMVTACVAVASFAANFSAGAAPLASLGYTIANLIEGWLVFSLMGRGQSKYMLLARPLNLVRFAGSAVIGGAASALMAGVLSRNFDTIFLSSWMSTVTLGMLIVTPVILFLLQDRKHDRGILTFRGFWIMVFVILTALAAFGQADVPLLILPLVAISITTAAIGLSGAVLALLLVATIGSVLTIFNLGPVGQFFPPVEQQVLFLQVYLLALLVSTLPVALSLARHRRDLDQIATSNRLLENAERAARVGHWRHTPEMPAIYWSDEAARMLDVQHLPRTLEELTQIFHETDQLRVAGLMATALQTGVPLAFEARIERDDGTTSQFECRTEIELGADGRASEVFGTIMDVTERAEALRELERARERAETEAAEVRILAETDHLTGIPNRRKIIGRLGVEMELAEAGDQTITIAMVDIDHFKSINDRFGHEVGDMTLVKVSQVLEAQLQGREMVGRLGGEEFLLVMPDNDAQQVRDRCLVLADALANLDWNAAGLERVTVSIGVAQYNLRWDESQLLRAADDALYRAKHSGRARCVVYEELEPL